MTIFSKIFWYVLSNKIFTNKFSSSDSWINHPGCGVSESFSNHRSPKKSENSIKNDRMINFEDDSEIDEKKRNRGRIIDGEVSRENAWPWQVKKIMVKFGQVWSSLAKSGKVWSSLVKFCKF